MRRFHWTPAGASCFSLAFAIVTLLTSILSRADEVYRSVDADGHVVYSDRPTTAAARKSEVHVVPPNEAEAARLTKETQLLKAEDEQRKQQEAIDNRSKTREDHDKQARCDEARNRYYSLKDANLLYHHDSNGNRVFYTDAEADAKREQARQAVVSACGKS